MKIKNIAYSLCAVLLLTACDNRQLPSNTTQIDKSEINTFDKKNQVEINTFETKKEETTQVVNSFSNKNEEDFLKILETDKYASLCNDKSKFLSIKQMQNSEAKSNEIKELFYSYVNNLSNSCIDQNAFKRKLRAKYYRDRNQDYEIYNVKLNKQNIINEFESSSNIESILKRYTPKHPQFLKLAQHLNDADLSESKRKKLRLNIERLKVHKYSNTNNFIQLNVPSHDFSFYENGRVTKSFGTVVGSAEHQTPIISDNLDYFILNPTWNIPDSIAKKIIKKALKDRNYLRKRNIVVRKTYDLNSKKINFSSVNWKPYLKDNVKWIPYKLIQLPSPTNGMGRMKFIFPNKYAVYMHDTIGTWRFKTNKAKVRFVSHGCIRLQQPRSLMDHLAKKYTSKSVSAVRSVYNSRKTGTIRLNKKLPVHLTYLTVKDNNGKLSYYSDIYGYDRIQKLNFIP